LGTTTSVPQNLQLRRLLSRFATAIGTHAGEWVQTKINLFDHSREAGKWSETTPLAESSVSLLTTLSGTQPDVRIQECYGAAEFFSTQR
jgi:hypothetical protein